MLPHIDFLQSNGIGVWYDRGINAGTIWRRKIDEELERATHLVFFVSQASLQSEHCEGEVHSALDQKKALLPVFLDDVVLTAGMRVALGRLQALYGFRLSSDALNEALRGAIRGNGSMTRTQAAAGTMAKPARSARPSRVVWTSAALATLIAIGSGVWWSSRAPHPTPLPTRSVAVLPFTATSDDPRMPYLAQAFVEALLNDLTSQRQIKVASRAAAAAKPADQGIPAFAAALGVSYVVEGSVRPGGDGDRVTVQLTRGSDGLHLWSQTFDFARDDTDMEAVTSRVALNAFLYVENDVDIAQARTETTNDEAFAHWEKVFRFDPSGDDAGTRAGQAQQLINLDKAIELDPGFPEPYIERAGRVTDRAEARRMIDRYLTLRPDSARGHFRRGMAQLEDGDLAAAEQSFVHARELQPEFPAPYSGFGRLAMRRGNAQEAADYFKQATVNDATKPSHQFYGQALFALGQFDEADHQFELALRVNPNDVTAIIYRVVVAHLRGRDDEANARFDGAWAKYGKTNPEWFIWPWALLGHEKELRNLMKEWDAGTRPANAGSRFDAYNALGEYDTAIDWLLRAIDEGTAPPYVRVGSPVSEIHKHPRWPEVLAKLDAKEISH